MIVLVGENAYARDEALENVIRRFGGDVERVDGSELTRADFIDRVAGGSLFASTRMVVVRGLSDNNDIWQVLPELLTRVSDDVQLVIVEDSIDKRTATWKALKKDADVQEFADWKDYDEQKAREWLRDEAKRRSVMLTPEQASVVVARTGPVQWRLADAIQKLVLFDVVTDEAIERTVPQQPLASVFTLMKTAYSDDNDTLHAQLQSLKLTHDPYQLMGLLAGQATQLLALVLADNTDDSAKDLGVSSFVLRELRPIAKTISKTQAKKSVSILLRADSAMKQGGVPPWQALETALFEIANT